MKHLVKFFILIVLNINISLLIGQKCAYNQNFDINGENLNGKIAAISHDQCCGYCSKNPQCQAWSWYNGQCQLKYRVPTGVIERYGRTCINGCL